MVSLISSVRLRMSNSLMFVTGDAKVLENGVLTPFTSVFFSLKNRQPSTMFLSEIVTDKPGGGGGECLQGNLWYSPPASLTSRLASVTFKMASKVFFELTDKISILSRKYYSDFLDLEISRSLLS